MRLLALPLLLLMACNCATVGRTVASAPEPLAADPAPQLLVLPAQPPDMVAPKGDTDKFWVPGLHLSTDINPSSARALRNFLQEAEQKHVDAAVVILTTKGGDMDSAYDMALAIEDTEIPVICVADYETKSAGFYVLQACDHRIMSRRTSLMTHDIAFLTPAHRATLGDLLNDAEELRTSSWGAAEHNARRMRCTPEYLERRLTGDRQWLFTWKEALRWKAVDGVVAQPWDVIKAWRKQKANPVGMLTEVPKPVQP